ncbi:MAG TPA: CoA-binding protein [Symbiobacteriaceae bacterium]|nr:CoA-binding protein [Symbiobacteriaceae bacterium]
MPSQKAIDEFLGQKRIAVVGVSRKTQEYTNGVYRLFKEKGYTLYPVNPNATEVEGVRCYPSVKDLPETVDGVLVMLPAAQCTAVAREAKEAGIPRIWFRTVAKEAADLARQSGMSVVEDACPYMFLGGFPHNIHRWFTKLEA